MKSAGPVETSPRITRSELPHLQQSAQMRQWPPCVTGASPSLPTPLDVHPGRRYRRRPRARHPPHRAPSTRPPHPAIPLAGWGGGQQAIELVSLGSSPKATADERLLIDPLPARLLLVDHRRCRSNAQRRHVPPLRLAGGREVVRVADGLGDLLGHDGFHEVGGVDPLQLSR